MPTRARPDVDSLENLTASIIVDQERMGANARSTVGTATDAYEMLRMIYSRLGSRTSVRPAPSASTSRPARSAARSRSRRAARRPRRARSRSPAGCAPSARGWVGSRRSTSTRWSTSRSRSTRARSPSRTSSPAAGITASTPSRASSTRTSRSATSPMPSGSASSTARRRRSSSEHQPHLRGARRQDPPPLPRQGRRVAPAEHPRGRRADLDHVCVPVVRRNAAQRHRALVAHQRQEHRRGARCRSAISPSCCAASTTRRAPRSSSKLERRSSRWCNRPRLPQPGSRVVHAVWWGVAAHEDGPPPGLRPDRYDLCLRRAHDRSPRARRGADERAPSATARQGQHGARRRARPRGDARRGSRRRHGAAGRLARRRARLRGAVRRARGVGHADRPAPRAAAGDEDVGAHAERRDPDQQRDAPQPAGRLGRRADRRAGRGHRRRRVRQELPDPRLHAADGSQGDGGRPVGHPRLAPIQPGDVHRHPRRDSEGVRIGQQGQARAVQRQLGGRVPGVQGARPDLHRSRLHGRRGDRLRDVRGKPLHR